jgi:hypothetical protein
MKNKIIFLDIDGVIATNTQFFSNSEKFRKKNKWAYELRVRYPFDSGCVAILNEILNETNSEIVLSSDWKNIYSLDELDMIFKRNKVIKSPIDITPNIYVSLNDATKNRAAQIEEYLNNNSVDRYVVIDDLPVGKFMQITNDDDKFVKTIEREGLKQTGIKDKILKILND